MEKIWTLDTLPKLKERVAGTRVLLRVDLNVPMRGDKISDITRIERFLPTVRELSHLGCKIILMSHFGRPNGKVIAGMSIKPLLKFLEAKMDGQKIVFLDDLFNQRTRDLVNGLPSGGVALLENLRFHAGEEANDKNFVEALAVLGDIYINDAFSAAHRAHASTEGLAHVLPSAAGRSMEAELEALESALDNPKRPVMALVGGAKVSSKLEILSNLVSKVDRLVIGGAMANTFLYALGNDVGLSLCEKDMTDTVFQVMASADEAGCQLVLPSDVVIAEEFAANVANQNVPIAGVRPNSIILDIGEETVGAVTECLSECKTILWNGPLGAFETKPFDRGTIAVAKAVANLTFERKLRSIAGGGETLAALKTANALDSFSYVSTAGGAFLEWLEGRELPGVVALSG